MLDVLIERMVQQHAAGPLRKMLRGWAHDERGGVAIFVNDDGDKTDRAERLFLALGDGPWRIEWTSEPEGDAPQDGEEPAQHSLYLEITLQPGANARQVQALLERLHAAVEQAALGEVEGVWENGDALALAIYGEDADAIFACALPYMESLPLRPIHGERRYGPPDDEDTRVDRFSLT